MKVLIIKPSSLGDIIQALPVAGSWKAHQPTVEIHWLVFSPFAPVLSQAKNVDRVWALPKKYLSQPLALWNWFQELRRIEFDVILDLQGLARSALLTRLAQGRERVGLASAREGARLGYDHLVADTAPSAAERYLETLTRWNIPALPHAFGLAVPPQPPVGCAVGQYRVLHPYTRWESKHWPWRHAVRLMQIRTELPWVVIGQGSWFPLGEARIRDVRNQLDLPSLAGLLAGARCLVSTDSGPAHLAAALGIETWTLFGPTDPKRTAPVGPRSRVLHTDLPCQPCLKRVCPLPESVACLSTLSPEQVAAMIHPHTPDPASNLVVTDRSSMGAKL